MENLKTDVEMKTGKRARWVRRSEREQGKKEMNREEDPSTRKKRRMEAGREMETTEDKEEAQELKEEEKIEKEENNSGSSLTEVE